MKNYALIGDVHSHSTRLMDALHHCAEYNLIPVLLGDLFDSREVMSESVKVYQMVRHAQNTLGAIVLQSNHQNKLIRYLKGNKVILNHGLDRTIEDFKNSPEGDMEELREWLESLPYGFVFRDKDGEEYRCAHAYFSSRIEVPDYDESFKVTSEMVNNKIKNIMIYGPVSSEGRIKWWESPRRHPWKMAAGHYHIIVEKEHCLIIDGQCGDEGEDTFLPLYEVNKKLLRRFY